ncbi:hypothetical protein LTR66_011079 [Elasticomyces elasticus]|nr:hypothetical protein LTR66_011079 [Elasticomyces elasticus]
MANCIFMGLEGQRHEMPMLWAFFCLAQILPISYTQNLFYIALLKQTPQKTHGVSRPSSKSLILPGLAYLVCLLVAPYASGSDYLIPVILVARALLLTPGLLQLYGSPKSTVSPSQSPSNRRALVWLSCASLAVWSFTTLRTLSKHSIYEMASAVNSHPAVSALGYDFLLSIVSWAAWLLVKTDAASEKVH